MKLFRYRSNYKFKCFFFSRVRFRQHNSVLFLCNTAYLSLSLARQNRFATWIIRVRNIITIDSWEIPTSSWTQSLGCTQVFDDTWWRQPPLHCYHVRLCAFINHCLLQTSVRRSRVDLINRLRPRSATSTAPFTGRKTSARFFSAVPAANSLDLAQYGSSLCRARARARVCSYTIILYPFWERALPRLSARSE